MAKMKNLNETSVYVYAWSFKTLWLFKNPSWSHWEYMNSGLQTPLTLWLCDHLLPVCDSLLQIMLCLVDSQLHLVREYYLFQQIDSLLSGMLFSVENRQSSVRECYLM